ncbi:carboxypeptidase regulatory-like domain-containing protein [Zhongshania sp.]|uniref:carboxypeptidase regulatory-like domain-containing protein n=1 Tax=Zhongshania sp. TaxID=1971902 RepID=UPI0035683DAC
MRFVRSAVFGVLAFSVMTSLVGCNSKSSSTNTVGNIGGGSAVNKCAVARLASAEADLITGPMARSRVGDFVLENSTMRAIVQKPGRNWFGLGQFGGNLIDAGLKNADGSLNGNDQFEEFILGTNVESSPNYQTVEVVSAGGEDAEGNCVPAIIRATGPDDLFELVNASSIIRGFTISGVPLQYPPSADDADLPLTFQTDYTLVEGKPYVRVDTKMINPTGSAVDLYLTEYISGSGELEVFQNGYGFGEPFVTAACDSCRFVVNAGHDGGAGVSYGLIHGVAGTTSVSSVGVVVLLYGRDFVDVATTPEGLHPVSPTARPNFTVPANGNLVFTRYFAVGNGTVASILDARNEILGLATGSLSGRVTDSSGGVANAEIAVLTATGDFVLNRGPALNVVNHFRTASDGRFSGKLPVGDYSLRINVPGRLAGNPSSVDLTVAEDGVTVQNFTVPDASAIRVTVKDSAGRDIPAKVQLIGADVSPDAGEPQNAETVLFALEVRSGVFGDEAADPLPKNIVLAEPAVRDTLTGPVTVGDTGVLPIEPGDYILSVSRGPRYTEFSQAVTVVAGQTLNVAAVLAEVVPTPNHLTGDFHVHSFQSLDGEVTDRERVANYISEGMDFFTPSDHEFRADFAPVIAAMGVEDMVASAPSAEMTTQDYGHYNAWPTAIETVSPDSENPGTGQSTDAKLGQGTVDWGGVAPAGEDFPAYGNYNLTPHEIVTEAKKDPITPGREVVVQINHIEGHFGPNGLGIDTGVNPPVSSSDPAQKRLNPKFDHPHADIAEGNMYTDDYDTLELWIGEQGQGGQDSVFLGNNLGDWFNLINQGRFHTAVSNSDTHDRQITALHARNFISVPAGLLSGGKANLAAVNNDPHTVGDSVRAGLTTMSNAPFMLVKAKNAGNQIAGLEVSDVFGTVDKPLPLATINETVTLDIKVKSPLWAEFDRVSVYVNGHTIRDTNELGIAMPPARYSPCSAAIVRNAAGDFTVNTVVVPNTGGAQRLEAAISGLSVASPGRDYWMVVQLEGRPGVSRPMWPIVPNDFVDGDTLDARTVADRGVYALAVSNPIFVDADNNGRWDAPGVLSHQGSLLDQCP